MKNFYDATITKPTLKLDVVLRVKPIGNVPARLQINDASWITKITCNELFKHEVGLSEPINIQIQIDRTHPEALEVELEIEGHAVLPLYQESLGVTCYIDNNDVWAISIPNFYVWYHTITGQGWII